MSRNCKLALLQWSVNPRRTLMSKSQDAKKAVKKEPAKTLKEKKAAKKAKKQEKSRQGPA